MIAQIAGNHHKKWDESLPTILTQGRELRLPRTLYDQVTAGTGAISVHTKEKDQQLKEIFVMIRKNLSKAQKKQQSHYNLRRRKWRPNRGDLVLAKLHPLSKASEKFAAN